MRKNPYAARAKISPARLRALVRCFALDLNAHQIAQMMELNRNTVNRYVHAMRERIAMACEAEAAALSSEPVQGSFVFMRRFHGVGREQQISIFVVYLRAGRICTALAPEEVKANLLAVTQGRVKCDRMFFFTATSLTTSPCDSAITRHERSQLESFWGLFKHKVTRLRGSCRQTFHLHLRECEFRFNHRHQEMQTLIMQMLKRHPLF